MKVFLQEEGAMSRPKKDYISLNMRVDAEIMKRFNAYCEEVGQTKTRAFERMVSNYLDQYERDKQEIEELRKQQK